MACTYRFKDASGKEVVITGQSAMKAYLAEGGLQELLGGSASPVAEIDDFGEKLAGARKDMQAALTKAWTDDEIASQPFSKVWPASEVDAIEDPFVAAVMHAARAEVPAKPRTPYKVKAWVEKVKAFRDITARVMDTYGRERYLEEMSKVRALDGFRAKVALLEAIDRKNWNRIGRVEEYPNAYAYDDAGNKVPSSFVRVEIDGSFNTVRDVGTISDAMEKVQSLLGEPTSEKKMQFEVRGNGVSFSINKKGDKEYRKLKTFESSKAALEYIKGNYDDLVAAWDAVKESDNVKKSDVRSEENRARTGADWRQGRDVTPEQFGETFGFRGVQFGNWVKQGGSAKDRQGFLNQSYDALMDLADIVGVPPKALSLNGSLGLAFGARGSGAASAHFEPGNLVINLTKTKGAGSLAHEWFHALDNYFSRQRGGEVKIGRGVGAQEAYRTQNYITYRPEPMYVHKTSRSTPLTKAQLERYHAKAPQSGYYNPENWHTDPSHPDGVRPEVERAFADLVQALDDSPMKARAAKNDKGADGYWSRIIERAARSFENYVIHKMQLKGYDNDYLANVRNVDDFARDKGRYPYLLQGEIAPVAEAFDALFSTLETKETDSGVALFRSNASLRDSAAEPDQSGPTREQAEDFIRRFVAEYPAAPEIILSDSFYQLPERIQQDATAQGSGPNRAKGALKNGKAYVILNNHRSMADLEATLFHEVLGHSGVRKLLGENFSRELNKLFIGLGGYSGLKRIMDKRGMGAQFEGYMSGVEQARSNNPDAWTDALAQSILTEEVFAHIAEQKSSKALRDRFMALVGMVRDWLRKHGFAELANLGESDIVFMLQRAREGLRNGDGVVRDGVTVGESVIVDSRGRPLAKEGSPEYEAMKILSERLGLRETTGPTVFSFAGEHARNADKHSLQTARSRILKGDDKDMVRKETGWFEGADGKWRYEINDQDARLNDEKMDRFRRAKPGSSYALSTLLDHPKLFAAYPLLKQLRVFDVDFPEVGGSYDNETTHLQLNLDIGNDKALSFLLHELQHAIQHYEGFAVGSSAFMDRNYTRQAGEVEARNVQSRLRFSEDERRNLSPFSTADVASEDVIFLFNGEPVYYGMLEDSPAVFSSRLREGQSLGDDARMDDANNVAGKQAPTPAGDVEAGGRKAGASRKPDFNAAAEQILAAIETDESMLDFGLRVIPGEFDGAIEVGDSLTNSFIWDNGDKTDEELPGVSTAGIQSATLDAVVRAIKNIGAHGKPGPNGYYFGDRVVLVRGEKVANGEDVGEFVIADPEVVGVWRKPTQGNSELIPNEPSASASSDAPSVFRTEVVGPRSVRTRLAEFFDSINGESAKTFNWWQRTIGSQYGKAKSDRDFGRVYDAAHAFLDGVADFAKSASALAPNILPHLDTLRDVAKGANVKRQWSDSKDYQAISSAIFEGTLSNGTTGQVWSDQELRDRFGLNDRQISLYREFRQSVDFSLETLADSEMARLARAAKLEVAGRDASMDDALAFYMKQLDPILKEARAAVEGKAAEFVARHAEERAVLADASVNLTDAQTKLLRDEMDRRHKRELDDLMAVERDAEALRDSFVGSVEQIRRLEEQGYAPLMRFGQYTVDVVKLDEEGKPAKDEEGAADRPFFGMFETESEAKRAAKILSEEYPGYAVTQGVLSVDSSQLYRGLTPETAELFARLLGTDEAGAFQAYLKQAVANRSATKRLINRMGIEGFSNDVPRVLAAFITSNARLASGNWHFGEMNKAAEAIPKHKGDVKDEAIRLMQYVQNPQEEAAGLRGFLFFSFLGGSIASAITNLTQTFSTTLPYLHRFAGPAVAKVLPKAMALSGKMMTKGLDAVPPGELRDALKKASDEGVVDPQEIHLLMAESGGNGASIGLSGLAGAINKEWATPAARVTRSLTQAWGMFFGAAEKYNRHVAFIAAWEVAPDGVDRYEFAKNAVTETQFDYTKASRPNWARGAVGATLFTFKTFAVNYVEFMSRLPPRERAVALGVLFLMAGLSGMPGADDLDDVVDTVAQKMGYNWNNSAARHAWLVKTLTAGGADFVERGLSSLLPLDVSARLGMGNLVPGSGVLMKSNDKPARDIQEFFGPIGSVFASGKDVFDNVGTGKGAFEAVKPLAPKSMGDIAQAIDMIQTGQYRDRAGRKVVDVDALDAAIKAIGFQPNVVAGPRRVERMLAQSAAMHRAVRQDIHTLMARGRYESDTDKVEAAREMMRSWNEKNPETPIRLNPTSVAQRVRAMRQTSAERLVKATPKDMRGALSAELAVSQ